MIAIAFALIAVLAAFLAGLLFGFIAGARYNPGEIRRPNGENGGQ